jgi:hypothetical protein
VYKLLRQSRFKLLESQELLKVKFIQCVNCAHRQQEILHWKKSDMGKEGERQGIKSPLIAHISLHDT